jgi:hypothetical protein
MGAETRSLKQVQGLFSMTITAMQAGQDGYASMN